MGPRAVEDIVRAVWRSLPVSHFDRPVPGSYERGFDSLSVDDNSLRLAHKQGSPRTVLACFPDS